MSEAVVGKLSEALKQETPVFCAWVGMNEPAVAEALAREAFDAVVLDMQHGALRLRRRLAGDSRPSRSPASRRSCGCRSASFRWRAGFSTPARPAIIAPMINSRDDARRLVAFTKFLPLGERSWGPRAVLPLSGLDAPAYLAAANAMTQTIAMIETRAALDALDDILAVEGVDGVFIGPSDLSIALSDGRSVRSARRGADGGGGPGRRPRQGARQIRRHVLLRRRRRRARWPRSASGSARSATDQTLLRAAARAELAAARAGRSPGPRKGAK